VHLVLKVVHAQITSSLCPKRYFIAVTLEMEFCIVFVVLMGEIDFPVMIDSDVFTGAGLHFHHIIVQMFDGKHRVTVSTMLHV